MSQASLFDLQPARRVWKVSELTGQIAAILEGSFEQVWIEGEVSNYRPAQSGHLYFTLKDSRSQIRCVCFRDQARMLKFRPEDGLQVTMRGSLGVYEPRGEYQIYVSHIEPVGAGALQLAFEQLKKKLQEEGLFEQSRKQPLPLLPCCIGVVTSPAGAAIRDILRVLKRRFANARVQIFPVKVQGDGAAGEIAAAIRYFNRSKLAEVLIVARGGGSLEDLWAFNEEAVARAIAASEIPVITGVGHETDFTIADFAADLRAPTPSAAAEIVVRSRQEFDRQIAEAQRHLIHRMRYLLSEWKHRARDLETHRGFRQLEMIVRRRRQQVDDMSASLVSLLQRRLGEVQRRYAKAETRILSFDLRARAAVLRRRIEQRESELAAALERLAARERRRFATADVGLAQFDLRARVGRLRRTLEQRSTELRIRMERLLVAKSRRAQSSDLRLNERSPLQLLQRGYAIAYDANGKVLRSADQVAVGDEVSVRLAKGVIDTTVERKKT
jgi:exodeoxyribonuclease VII large subunit